MQFIGQNFSSGVSYADVCVHVGYTVKLGKNAEKVKYKDRLLPKKQFICWDKFLCFVFFYTCNSLFKFGTVDVLTLVEVYMYLQTVWYC